MDALAKLGFSKVVCLCSTRPIYTPSPLELANAVELDDLEEGGAPRFPQQEAQTFADLAAKVCWRLDLGEGVIVHCAGGRGRTGTLIGAVLVMSGWTAKEATQHLDRIHKLRGKSGWPESPCQSALLDQFYASQKELKRTR